jgi:hypothetical protein
VTKDTTLTHAVINNKNSIQEMNAPIPLAVIGGINPIQPPNLNNPVLSDITNVRRFTSKAIKRKAENDASVTNEQISQMIVTEHKVSSIKYIYNLLFHIFCHIIVSSAISGGPGCSRVVPRCNATSFATNHSKA